MDRRRGATKKTIIQSERSGRTTTTTRNRERTIKKIAKQFIVGQLLFAKVPLKDAQTYEL